MTQVAQDQYLTVKALTRYIKRKFDQDPYMQKVYVVGEVSSYRHRKGGHQYFTLKDDQAKIPVTMFRPQFERLDFELQEGMKVFAVGKINVYEGEGRYQLILDSLQPDGIGALYQALNQRIEKFRQAGLFEKLQRPLVPFPKKIAVITSPSGAVIQDILTTIKRRFPIVQVTLFPTKVQGKEAVGDLIQAFDAVYARAQDYDTIILARGGGSIEDLWCFNDELLAHKILESPIPVISSIGHETDTSLSDLVADLRAPTPTAAAELAVPVLGDLLAYLAELRNRLYYGVQAQVNHKTKRLKAVQAATVLTQPARLYQAQSQKLDILTQKLIYLTQNLHKDKAYSLGQLVQRLNMQSPHHQVSHYQQRLSHLSDRLHRHTNQVIRDKRSLFQEQVVQLQALSPLKILSRGYAFVESKGQIINTISQVTPGDTLTAQVSDGKIIAQVVATQKEEKDGNE